MELNPLFSELLRLVARCPRLRRHRGISSLLNKGHAVAEDEVVEVLAGVSLHPEYTIPILSCLRRVGKKLVQRTVSLLRVVPNLGTDSGGAAEGLEVARSFGDCQGNDAMEIDEVDEEVNVIESYSREGRGLELHELACFAFSRALDLLPFLKGCVQSYFEFSPPPFARILKTSSLLLSSKICGNLLHLLRISYLLLHGNLEHFSCQWNWCWILDLLKQCENIHPDDNTEYMKNINDIKWCGTHILSLLLRLPDKASPSFGLKAEEAMSSLLRWQEFGWDVLLEQSGWFLPREDNLLFSERCAGEMDQAAVSYIHCIETKLPQARATTSKWNDRPFVMTSAVKRSFQRVVLAVNQRWPVLLHGSAGCGKTALINKLASDSGRGVLSIHMDDQIDGKTLVGSYVCSEQPGEFRWQPGSLTQAVASGLWVVFENIDQATSDVHSVLLPLMEGRNLFVTGHDEAVKVDEGFRLFSTISTQKLDSATKFEGSNTLSSLWRRIMIAPPNSEDIKSIITAVHPDLEPIAQTIIDIFVAVSASAGFSSKDPCTASSFSRFSSRDVLKFCKRIAGSGFRVSSNSWSLFSCKQIYEEAADIFGSASAGGAISTAICETIARMCDVPFPPVTLFCCTKKPIFEESGSSLKIGRVTLQSAEMDPRSVKKPFVQLHSSLTVLERIACSVKYNEPVLLVGETGTGKTTLVQYLAMKLGQRLTVLNLSQQSDVADLLGGVKPVDARSVCIPLYKEFLDLFSESGLAGAEACKDYLVKLQICVGGKNWNLLLKKLKKVAELLNSGNIRCGTKRRKRLQTNFLAWRSFSLKVDNALRQITSSSGMLFSFVEGAFITALRKGDWILLDEVNLAPAETLQRIIGVLEGENGSLCLAEKGDVDYIQRNTNFRIFACMNPANDAGKRDLPYSLRSRFSEYFVNDVMDEKDLSIFVGQFIDNEVSQLSKCPHSKSVDKIVKFYIAAKEESERSLQDGANQKPQYSLRSLFRALEYTRATMRKFGFQRALYDGFVMFFMTLLDGQSAVKMAGMIKDHLLDGKSPEHTTFDRYLVVGETQTNGSLDNYVLTKSVRNHLTSLARAMLIKRYPVLLQGPTSSGKTSMVRYLAEITGHEFVRINNHEHTDLQEYLGSYITDHTGELVFHEGVLVKAVRSGQWIVLDELNLAPSDVLEALNRLLDDNRELFVPELQETVRAHPDFMLFATQNPPTFYGGRKVLSRAFRNRFVEIQVDEIPDEELSTILEERCKVPRSYAEKMVGVMKDLQLRRRGSKVFAGKHGFITPRDLFRWAQRFHKSEKSSREDLALDGYLLLAERLRDEAEKNDVQEVLKSHLGAGLVLDNLYEQGLVPDQSLIEFPASKNCGDIIWTKSMKRLYFLVKRCYEMREPVLLVGETGGGKTTVCQLLSMVLGSKLHILNCHQYTETSDFIGGFFPIRERSKLVSEFKSLVQKLLLSKPFSCFLDVSVISEDINHAASTLEALTQIVNGCRQGQDKYSQIEKEDLATFEQTISELSKLQQKWQTIFTWQDGPLVHAMKHGDLFLVDEISLADDSVLERLNSVLEPERKLALAEKGGPELEKLTANPNFFLLATMNPGGDYGKKELSPALRNRFTEIWVPSVSDVEELGTIAEKKFSCPGLARVLVGPMLKFWEWFNELQTGRMLTVRDLLSWVAFINASERSLSPEYAFLHGAFLVLLDGLTLGTGITEYEAASLRKKCLDYIVLELQKKGELDIQFSMMGNYGWNGLPASILEHDGMECENVFGIHPFFIERGDDDSEAGGFELMAPTTRRNALRILRAMQLSKPVLLEGSPGVGKTSLIVALGKYSGHKVVRINLSEQTDLMDLLGSDLPIESDTGIQFAWSDGILLQALKDGAWVLLDELNLAPQSVLEGLNAILDHRAEVFIPELGLTFKCPPSFRVFACQNPTYQGGGRKGLPKSFLNRFTKVYVDQLDQDDYHAICSSLFPDIASSTLEKLILFNKRLYEETMIYHKFGQDGSPWEFNLRDVIRSCQIIKESPIQSDYDCFLNAVYIQRMRTAVDRREVIRLYTEVFGGKPYINPYPRVELKDQFLLVGKTHVRRGIFHCAESDSHDLKILPEIQYMLEAASQCVKQQWLCILVGPTSSGKTSLVRLLAQLTSNILHEINLSSATDISELLGCFEQYNAFRNYRSVVSQVEYYVKEYCNQLLTSLASNISKEVKDSITTKLAFLLKVNLEQVGSSSYADTNHWGVSLSLMKEVITMLRSDLEMNVVSLSCSSSDLGRALHVIQKLQGFQRGSPIPVKFQWAAGILVRAIENGEWIVLEDANLCNPTVLDRINSLAESNGSITVNECGNVDGKPLTLNPHPNFRLFLTVNPMYGEISRAMRNRGVEIFMMQPNWILEEDECGLVHEKEMADVKRFLALSNIPNSGMVDLMAKAHIYARDEGFRCNVKISYLELTRWIQLFRQLIMNGGQLLGSLHLSWEHIYLSSFGESQGWDIVDQAKASYLSLANLTALQGSLTVLGGWPMPLSVKDFISFPLESSVMKNCLYLRFLGSEYATYQRSMCKVQSKGDIVEHPKSIYVVDTKTLGAIMYPETPQDTVINNCRSEFNIDRVHDMLMFAADWMIEQATESDIELYLCWLSWYDFHLQPYCQFFQSFLELLRKEQKHPLWTCIYDTRRYVADSVTNGGLLLQSFPMLSLESVELMTSKPAAASSSEALDNAINCVGLLRRTLWQWRAEDNHDYVDKSKNFKQVLESLRMLETQFLREIVKYSHSHMYFQLYSDLLDEHVMFWNCVAMSHFDLLLLYWRSLIKKSVKLEVFCPEAVKMLLEVSNRPPWPLRSCKPMLWVHGGHPFMPSTADVYYQLKQLFALSEVVWSVKKLPSVILDDSLIDFAVSLNSEFRRVAVEGLCMSSYVMHEYDKTEIQVVEQLAEIYKLLSQRYQREQKILKEFNEADRSGANVVEKISCCTTSPEMICTPSGFDCWLQAAPVFDQRSLLLDLPLLQKLPEIVVADTDKLHMALSRLSGDLESALHFSLKFSSRSPVHLLAHQKILWTLDAWASAMAVDVKIASSTLEMWFRWHSLLWNNISLLRKDVPGNDCNKFVIPNLLFRPVMTQLVEQTVESAFKLREYFLLSSRLKAGSHSIWQSTAQSIDLNSSLLHAAHSLLQQIIFAHRKSFSEEKFAAIRAIYPSLLLPEHMNKVQESGIQVLISLLKSSTHKKFTFVVQPLIDPLLQELYLGSSSNGNLYNTGCAWRMLGELRFHLLLGLDDLDPAAKFMSKYTQITEKISSLELEMKVRQECNYLSGSSSDKKIESLQLCKLRKLDSERKVLRRKIVFREDHGKFKKLKNECDEFLKFASTSKLGNFQSLEIVQFLNKAKNWQETASCFIERLSDEYAGYADVIQPIQVAVYEMKLGVSLVASSVLEKNFLHVFQEEGVASVVNAVCSFMRFPRQHAIQAGEVKLSLSTVPLSKDRSSVFVWDKSIGILKKFVKDFVDIHSGKKVSPSLSQDTLGRVMQGVANTQLMDATSFLVLDELFADFASIWVTMKADEEIIKGSESQEYKFKPRRFDIEDFCDIDLSSLGDPSQNSTFAEWNEYLREEDGLRTNDATEESKTLSMWNAIEESALNNVVAAHRQLFGSLNLLGDPRTVRMSDPSRLLSFLTSYTIGAKMVKDLGGISSFILDSELGPEHLFRLCLEHEQKLSHSRQSAQLYNFYKDSNSSALVCLVKLLVALQKRVSCLLNDWEDHPGLQRICNIVEMLLAIPLHTPLAKVLSGLQFLFSRFRTLQEEGSKVPLKDEFEPIHALACSWQRMEVDSWSTALDEVQIQFERNADKLWFPLYSVLHPRGPADIVNLVQSLGEFIETSNVGEFRRRLQLVLAFHGQATAGVGLGSYTSPFQMETMKILYNLFGTHIQLLPIVVEHVSSMRKRIEKKLEELVKLCHWNEKLMSIEDSKRYRQKLKKIVHEYTEMLQQPIMLIIQQKSGENEMKLQHLSQTTLKCQDIPSPPRDLLQFSETERTAWHTKWRIEVKDALKNMPRGWRFESEYAKDVMKRCSVSSVSIYQQGWFKMWGMLENIYVTAIDCASIWNEEGKNPLKVRALDQLLKFLEGSGLAKHKSAFPVMNESDQCNAKTWWLFLPSYEMKHLLVGLDAFLGQEINVGYSDVPQFAKHEMPLFDEWREANQYYFKGLASVHKLSSLCVNFDHERVGKSRSFLSQLIVIQQDQRDAAYNLSKNVKKLRDRIECLKSTSTFLTSSAGKTESDSFTVPNQQAMLWCLWKQKDIFDSLLGISEDEILLLKTVCSAHLSCCDTVRPAAIQILGLIERYLPVFRKSKVLLDRHLLGDGGSSIKLASEMRPVIVSKEMELLIIENFKAVKEFEDVWSSHLLKLVKGSVEDVLLGYFHDVISKAKEVEEEYLEGKDKCSSEEDLLQCERGLCSSLDYVFGLIMEAFKGLLSRDDVLSSKGTWERVTAWKSLFEPCVQYLKFNILCEELTRVIAYAVKLTKISKQSSMELFSLRCLLDLVMAFCDGFLRDILITHKTVAILTHTLAETFTVLFSKGYQSPNKDPQDESSDDATKDASGTGMGEGTGAKDVSDQITDEDQLLGTSEKKEEEDGENQMPSKNNKGIEMEEDFEADAFDLSEDSGGDDDDGEDEEEKLDSEMGKAGDDKERVNEKLSSKEQDENLGNVEENNDSGPSVKDEDNASRELRGKDEDHSLNNDELEGAPHKIDEEDDADPTQDGADDLDDKDELNTERKDAFPEEGLELDEPDKKPDEDGEIDADLPDFPMEDGEINENDSATNDEADEEMDEANQEGDHNQFGEAEEDQSKNNDEGNRMDSHSESALNDYPGQDDSKLQDDLQQSMEAQLLPIQNLSAPNPSSTPEVKWSTGSANQSDFTLSDGASQLEIMLENSNGEKQAQGKPKSQAPEPDSSSKLKDQPNPLRSIGDALQGWKERVQVSTDVADNTGDTMDDVMDDDAIEYGFTSEFDKGTAQAQGSAMPDQVDLNMPGDKPEQDGSAVDVGNEKEMKTPENKDYEPSPVESHVVRRKGNQAMLSSLEELPEEEIDQAPNHGGGNSGSLEENIVSVERSYMQEDLNQRLRDLCVDQHQLRKVENYAEISTDTKNNATVMWRKYELRTERMSQELAEQLRLIMEPTLASKLQGDYRTGKRINMKKVIPYIASHYRKDKIWLRRTRPNKRDYQVVIAVDDSRSMLESGCGNFAIEALLTVCRAMSQLEVGKLAVASFGKEGNLKLLHDFEQPFTGEAGINMISSLTFEQENTIVDEPMVELMTNLNGMLNEAAANARLPSGQNPLQQLVLIIADGRFHEKEKLKSRVRELLNQRRMVAFLLLDSPTESIMELQEASFEGGKLKMTKYLDSFPFPYYIILKNIDSLPRTLADLLRQWFEVLQNSRD